MKYLKNWMDSWVRTNPIMFVGIMTSNTGKPYFRHCNGCGERAWVCVLCLDFGHYK